jgi:hypothetical protein
VSLADFVDGGEVAGFTREVEPLFVAAADAVGDGFWEAVGFVPDEFGAEDESELVDASEGVAPWEAHE